MSVSDFKSSITYLGDKAWPNLGIRPTHLTIEYVGGEILLVPPRDLIKIVEFAREYFGGKGITVIDGAQSNLIGSERRLNAIKNLFNGRVGTSIDDISDQRTLSGSAAKYEEHHNHGLSIISSDKNRIPAVFTLDKTTYSCVVDQYSIAQRDQRNLTVRQVFGGGKDVGLLSPSELTESLLSLLNAWAMKSTITVEPLKSLLTKRMKSFRASDARQNHQMCPFQSDCSSRSMSLEPNGDLFICQEMADANYLNLGNALTKSFNLDNYRTMRMRPGRLESECYSCPYFAECQGGCAMEAIQFGEGPHGKSHYCETWKALFSSIDNLLDQHGHDNVKSWVESLG